MDLFQTQPAEKKSLRPHQKKGIELLRASIRKGNRRIVLQMATGGGKTLTAAEIIAGALRKENRSIFTAPAISLIDQTVRAFEAEGIFDIGVMQADHPRTDPRASVQVASVQTLANRAIPHAAIVLVDECHIRAAVIEQMMAERPDLLFVGLSATPWAVGMGLLWQDLIIAATTKELMDAGYLCPFRVFTGAVDADMGSVRSRRDQYGGLEYSEAGSATEMSKAEIVGDVVSTWLEKGEGRPTLLFAVNRAHAASLHEAFGRAGVATAYVDMFTDRVERAMIERQMRSGEVKIACSVRTLTTGVDWEIACIIDAAPTKSEILHVQKIGRGLRVNPPWEDCIILDHAGNTSRLGFVTDIHHELLDCGDRKSASSSSVKEEVPLPSPCPSCRQMLPPRTNPCTNCGHERKMPSRVLVKGGDLVELDQTKKVKKKTFSMEEKQRFWSMAVHLDRERKKGGKYAKALYREKFGVWPGNGMMDIPKQPSIEFMNYEKSRRIAFAKRKPAGGVR